MAQQNKAHVPKFGNWDNDGNVPYTVYFENARKGKGGKMINPNDPAENPEAFSVSVAAPSPNRSDAGGRPPTAPPRHERRPSDAPPLSPNPYAAGSPSPYHRSHAGAGGEAPRRGGGGGRASGSSGGGGYSVEQSPVHPYSFASESGGYGGGGGLVASSAGRARGKSGNETPTRGSALPKFGDWDSNPASADGYTHIFNKVREEKQSQVGKPAAYGNDAERGNGAKQHDDGYVSSKFSCFGWCK